MDTLTQFAGLFGGRGNVFFDGGYATYRRLSLAIIRDHLSGSINGIGSYPVSDSGRCKWSCIDLDGPEYDFSSAVDVWSVWRYYGITAWIERSRSKGWHIWTFSDGWCPAYVTRYAGLHVAKISGLPDKIEVNPKNIAPWKTANGLVNTVRLPYAGRAAPGRQVIVDALTALPLSVEDFTAAATAARTPRAALVEVAGHWQRARRAHELERRYSALRAAPSGAWHSSSQSQEAWQILIGNRNVKVHERDNQLFTLAKLMYAMKMDRKEALDKMRRIWYDQLEDKSTYQLETALSKIERVYASYYENTSRNVER